MTRFLMPLSTGLALMALCCTAQRPGTIDPAQFRYPFPLVQPPAPNTDSVIRDLEGRVGAPNPSALDAAELADAYFRRAQMNGDPGELARAEAMAHRSLAILPEPNGAHLTLAKIAGARHDFRESIALARAQLARKPSAGCYAVLATAYLAVGQLVDATDAADAAARLAPSLSAYLLRALIMQAQGRDAEAAFDFARALNVEAQDERQESTRARALWGRFLLRRGNLDAASALVDEALRIAPANPLALAQRAEIALRRGELARARQDFEQAFAASRQVRYLMDLARAQELGGDSAAAESSRTQVETLIRAELRQNGLGHQLDLVEILNDRARPADIAEAVVRARDEVERRPSVETRFQLARALARSGAKDEAKAHVHAALTTGVHDARLYELAARLESGPRAAMYAEEAQALDPGASGWRQLGMAD